MKLNYYLCGKILKTYTMRRHLLLLALAMAASALQAQHREDMYSLLYHDIPGYFVTSYNVMQQRDGDYVVDVYLLEDLGNYESAPYGRVYYKISSATHAIVDSLFVAETSRHITFLSRDPRGEGNIRAAFEYHEGCDSTFVRISRFHDYDLHSDPEEDVVAPVCEGDVWEGPYGSLLDSRGDLVMTYYRSVSMTSDNLYVARIGLDGTLKHQALLAEDQWYSISALGMLKESPLQYYQWSGLYSNPNVDLDVYVMDSLFQMDTVRFNCILKRELLSYFPFDTTLNIYEYEHLLISYDTQVIPAGGNDVLVAAQYVLDTNFWASTQDYGVAVARYDLSTKKLKGYVVFNDNHDYWSTGQIVGLKMMSDGTVYFMYKEYGCSSEQSVVVVKMDANLYVEWRRVCKTWDVSLRSPLDPPIVIEDEDGEEKGIVWLGYGDKVGSYKPGWVCFFLNHDGMVGVTEDDKEMRPYAYWPNPAQDELYLQYSPDVKPTQIELFDIQGRLVRSQRNGLERLNLQGLPAGTYTMRVTLEDGKVFSDKVVKE